MTSAGTAILISPTIPATFDSAGYKNLKDFVEIGEVSDLGEFGREYNIVKFQPLKDRRTVKRKGSYDDGTVTIQLAKVASDAGQQALNAALNSDVSRSIQIVLQDGSTFFFTAQVASGTTNVGNVDQITSGSVKLEIDTDIIEIAA